MWISTTLETDAERHLCAHVRISGTRMDKRGFSPEVWCIHGDGYLVPTVQYQCMVRNVSEVHRTDHLLAGACPCRAAVWRKLQRMRRSILLINVEAPVPSTQCTTPTRKPRRRTPESLFVYTEGTCGVGPPVAMYDPFMALNVGSVATIGRNLLSRTIEIEQDPAGKLGGFILWWWR